MYMQNSNVVKKSPLTLCRLFYRPTKAPEHQNFSMFTLESLKDEKIRESLSVQNLLQFGEFFDILVKKKSALLLLFSDSICLR